MLKCWVSVAKIILGNFYVELQTILNSISLIILQY